MFIVYPILAQLFRQPMYLPTNIVSLLWTLPICLSIALVYKTLKLQVLTVRLFVREVALLFITLLGFLTLGALLLLALAWLARL